jgi:hypothetical protein
MRSAHVALCTLLLSPAFVAHAARQILPAGALINCTVSEGRLSSGTAARDCRLTRISKGGLKITKIPGTL